jgi:putative RecB family exonuclease
VTTTAERLIEAKTSPRSVSQAKQYDQCPQQYYLARIAVDIDGNRIWERPAAWLPQGTAVHKAAEMFERSGRSMALEAVQEVYAASYVEETDAYLAKATMDTWSHSGPYGGEADISRRFEIGLTQTQAYFDYYTTGPGRQETIVTIGGVAAIELPFEAELDGIKIRGYIDAVVSDADGRWIVRDNKTGIQPGDEFQLAVYAAGIRTQYGDQISWGDYWMARKGKPTKAVDLSQWSVQRVADVFRSMDTAVKAERFEAKPEVSKCGRCSFNSYCDYVAF